MGHQLGVLKGIFMGISWEKLHELNHVFDLKKKFHGPSIGSFKGIFMGKSHELNHDKPIKMI